MYDGIPCTHQDGECCYNGDKWCTDPSDFDTCSRIDNGAYPIGDERVFGNQMTDPLALTPFPNAIFWNWATIFILGFGNLAALDFQVRCMAAINPRTAIMGCLIGGCFTFFIGVPFSYLGAITRYVTIVPLFARGSQPHILTFGYLFCIIVTTTDLTRSTLSSRLTHALRFLDCLPARSGCLTVLRLSSS